MSELLTYREAAEYLRVAESTLRHWVSARRIACVRYVGRTCFRRRDLELFVAAHRVAAIGE